ncbi:flippase [Thermodesulforhabdus norvegica]|uniref:flippase n=1 Tax=Thermodesulforhabdus norvegica TaxID=39841 RepID=UPI001FE0F675|nr:flippase [Thermodesulforhabdus norvegica]
MAVIGTGYVGLAAGGSRVYLWHNIAINIQRVMKGIEEGFLSSRLGRAVARAIGKPGSLRFRLARDTVGVMVLKAISMGLGFLISVVLARMLGAAGYGVYAYVWSVVTFLSIPATFGLPQLLVRNIAAYQVKERWGHIRGLLHFADQTVLVASLTLTALLGLGMWFLSDRIDVQTKDTFLIALPLLVLMALLQIRQMSLQGLSRVVQGQMLALFVRPTLFILLIASAYLLFAERITPSLAMGMQVVAFAIAFLTGALLLKKHLPKPVEESSPAFEIRPWVKSALPLLGIGVLGVVTHHTDILMLGGIKGAEAVGIYKVGFQLALLISFGLLSVGTVISPTISALYTTEDRRDRLQRVITRAVYLSVFSGLPLALIFLIAGKQVLVIIFGQEFALGAATLAILSLGQLFSVIVGPTDIILIMTGYENYVTKGLSITAGTNVILNALFIPLWGIKGAAIATTISIVLLNTLLAVWVYRKTGINPTIFGGSLLKERREKR